MINTDIITCLDVIHSHSSFIATNGNNEKYNLIFHDSSYCWRILAEIYMVQFGIVSYIKRIIYSEVKEMPFTFYFDEITTSQLKKQYNVYATYYSYFFQQIITEYLGTLLGSVQMMIFRNILIRCWIN